MSKQKRVAVIGHFGGNETILDGQTVKTKILYEELTAATEWHIQPVDTYYKKRNPLKLLWNTAAALLRCRDVIVLLSGNGMRLYFPLLSLAAKCLGTRVYHDVIGGNLDQYVKDYPKFRRYLSRFQVNWVETDGLKNRLVAQGVHNCSVIPNFKRLRCLKPEELSLPVGETVRFCTFSRVMREKGIEDAIEAVEAINREAGTPRCTLDIYGSVDAGYASRFEEVLKAASPAIRYAGQVPYEKSVEAIGGYHALLFPTFWHGEGFPGTVVDAYSAGLPVIASDWNCNRELIETGVTGLLYPGEQAKDLWEAIGWFMENIHRLPEMKAHCLQAAGHYQPDAYIRRMVQVIEEKG